MKSVNWVYTFHGMIQRSVYSEKKKIDLAVFPQSHLGGTGPESLPAFGRGALTHHLCSILPLTFGEVCNFTHYPCSTLLITHSHCSTHVPLVKFATSSIRSLASSATFFSKKHIGKVFAARKKRYIVPAHRSSIPLRYC